MNFIYNILFFTKRSLQASFSHPSLRMMLIICTGGIALTSFATALIWCIAQGFSTITLQTLTRVYPDIIVNAYPQSMNTEKCIKKIHAICPQALCSEHNQWYIIMHNDELSEPLVLQLRTINLQSPCTTQFPTCLLDNTSLQTALQNKQLCIGKHLANTLQTQTGEPISFSFSPDSSESLKKTSTIIGGIFHTGLYEYDKNVVYCSESYAQELFDLQGSHTLYIKLPTSCDNTAILTQLKNLLPSLQVYTWQELYPGLAASLQLEQYALAIILLLIFIMATCNSVGLLFMLVHHKVNDLAIMYAMGGSLYFIKAIFTSFALIISSISCIVGLICARIGATLIRTISVPLPEDIYYSNHLPVVCNVQTFVIILTLVICLTFFASLLATWHLKKETMYQVLKKLN